MSDSFLIEALTSFKDFSYMFWWKSEDGVWLSCLRVFDFVLRSFFPSLLLFAMCVNDTFAFFAMRVFLRVFIFMTPLLPLLSSAKSFVCCYRACLLIGF